MLFVELSFVPFLFLLFYRRKNNYLDDGGTLKEANLAARKGLVQRATRQDGRYAGPVQLSTTKGPIMPLTTPLQAT